MSRIERLKAALFEVDDRVLFLERMRIIADCAERYPQETMGRKFGLTLQALLSGIALDIQADDLLVGRVVETLPTAQEEQWYESNQHRFLRPPWFQSNGHLTISWERLLSEGLVGIRSRAAKSLDGLADDDPCLVSKRDFLEGALLCCDAIAAFAERYASHAKALAQSAPSPERRDELLEIARILARVPAQPAQTFHQAVQSIWLVDLVLHAVVGSRDFALGRLDQYLLPYFRRDITSGRLSADRALELIQCLYIKCSEIIGYADQNNAKKRSLCQDSVQYVVLAGQTADGRDATNPLSFLCLHAGHLNLKQPTIKVRYHEGIDPDFWRETCRLARAGGSLGIYNDGVEVPAYLSVGVSLTDARNYVHYGCCNANIPGKEGSLMERWHSLPKFLELALNDGWDPVRGAQCGPHSGTTEELTSFDRLLSAFSQQVRHALEAERANYPPLSEEALRECSFTAESIFLEGCIEAGREWRLGGTPYWHKSQHGVGIATVTDSLAAIRELVYDSGEMTLAELGEALATDFAGSESLRQRLLNTCGKFGNDDDAVDALAAKVSQTFCDEVVRYNKAPHSVRFWPEIYSYHNNRRLGRELGATADGRKAGEPLSENQSPSYGMDRVGVTACLSSIAKLPLDRTPGGGTNLRLHPSAVDGEAGLQALSDLFVTYFRQGGQHLQLNVVDSAQLREAQTHPDQHRALSVRVTGYSAYFVTLSRAVQDDLIRRTEHLA